MNTNQFVESARVKFSNGGFKTETGIVLSNGRESLLTASRTRFSWKGLVILSQHVVIIEEDDASIDSLKEQFDVSFAYGKKNNWVPLLRGMQFGYMIIPCVITSSPNRALIEYAKSSPRKHWSIFELPVVIDSQNGNCHYFTGTGMWGAFFFSDMRTIVKKCLVNSKTEEENSMG